jgi:hypothetical protein
VHHRFKGEVPGERNPAIRGGGGDGSSNAGF